MAFQAARPLIHPEVVVEFIYWFNKNKMLDMKSIFFYSIVGCLVLSSFEAAGQSVKPEIKAANIDLTTIDPGLTEPGGTVRHFD
jgi:hypothetical protein